MAHHDKTNQPILSPCFDYEGWTVWVISWDMIQSNRLRDLPCLDGTYLLDGDISPFYGGSSGNIFRRLRNHHQPWRTALGFTLGESSLEWIDRQYLEFTLGLMLLLNDVEIRNGLLEYPKPDREAAAYGIAFLNEALVPFWREYGSELNLPTRNLCASAKQVSALLSRWGPKN